MNLDQQTRTALRATIATLLLLAGTPALAASASPSPRQWHAMTTADGNRIAMFGGDTQVLGKIVRVNEFWTYDAGSGQWALMPNGRTYPTPRVHVGFSCNAGQCVVANGANTGYLKETWLYSLSRKTWTQVNCKRYLCPPARRTPAMAYDPTRGYHVLFGGGYGWDTVFDDTYTFAGGLWNAQYPASRPPARESAAAAFVPSHQPAPSFESVAMDRVVIFGGYDYVNFAALCDMWSWDGANWTRIDYQGTIGPCLRMHNMAWDSARTRLIVTSGFTDPPDPPRTIQDIPNTMTWAFTFTGTNRGKWSLLEWPKAPYCTGTPSTDAEMAYDQATGYSVYFGGADNLRGGGMQFYSNLVLCK